MVISQYFMLDFNTMALALICEFIWPDSYVTQIMTRNCAVHLEASKLLLMCAVSLIQLNFTYVYLVSKQCHKNLHCYHAPP